MFTGIIETLATVHSLRREHSNLHLELKSPLSADLKVDQSVAHNGVCLTVVAQSNTHYTVTAIEETLQKTNLNDLVVGDKVNLERAMKLGARLDGHLVQGHVDTTAICTSVEERDGSWWFSFSYEKNPQWVTIEKGSIAIDGTSLTVVDSKANRFSVAIIPYTYEHTRFNTYSIGTRVNLEFDLIGKYVARLTQQTS